MQIVGLSCATCSERIRVATEATWCPECQIPFHLECATGDSSCPSCGRDPTTQRETRLQRETGEPPPPDADAVARGKAFVSLAIVGYLGPSLVIAVLMVARDPSGVFSLVRTFIGAGLLYMLWEGHRWAYVLWMVLLAIGMLASLGRPSVATYALAAVWAGCLVLLATPSARAFLRSHRHNHEDD